MQRSAVVAHDDMRAVAERMGATLRHRGPDDCGTWVDSAAGIALAHQRLAVIDLSAGGHQPMRSASGRFVLAYNGEVYNFHDLRDELEVVHSRWRGHSDTEVMLAAFERWDVAGALRRFNGMFAFALWDRDERALYLARDRLGEKPLYYGWVGQTFIFGSELKALRAHPAWRGEVDRDALAAYLRHNCVPSPYSIYRDISKLPAGHYLRVDLDSRVTPAVPQPYWSMRDAAEAGVANPAHGDQRQIVDEFEKLLLDAVQMRTVADVPVGVFLSGGVDSSTVVALMQVQASRPVKSFSIGFAEQGYDEAPYARAVAQHLGTDHTELYVTPADAMSVIPELPRIYDEPFADSSQIPTVLVSRLAREHVTVALSGDGGDELFCGYVRYFWGRRIWNKIKCVPYAVRSLAGRALVTLSPESWNAVFQRTAWAMSSALGELTGDRVHKLAEVLAVRSPDLLYHGLVSHWTQPESVVLGSHEPSTALTDSKARAALSDFTLRMMYLDTVSYLPDDILVKVDRASMSVALEARVPLLDHRVVELAWRVPLAMKLKDGKGKWLLREVLHRYVPRELIDRPKMGFGVPLDTWLRGPLRDWAETLLSEARLRNDGFFDPAPIRRQWLEHLSGVRNWQYWLWDVLMFQSWLDARRHEATA